MCKLSMLARIEIITKERANYWRANKRKKGEILDKICDITGYSRNHAASILRNRSGKNGTKSVKRGRKKKYGIGEYKLIKEIWHMSNGICGKRLKMAIPIFVEQLKRHKELNKYQEECVIKVLSASASTIDRLLKKDREKNELKGRSTTKPGTLLKQNIPIRTWSDWNEEEPGFFELDLVAHCGDSTRGEYVNTLDVTDIETAWTETQAVLNKAQEHVFKGIEDIRGFMPIDMKGIDSDNGAEFINHELYRYCEKENIVFTRSRPYKKNDNCHVEEKNWSIVRKHMGYGRYEGHTVVKLMNEYYKCLRLMTNFLMPSFKLISKTRCKSKIVKKYDTPQTPYDRLLKLNCLDQDKKKLLKKTKDSINPKKLTQKMEKIKKQILKLEIMPYDY